MKASEFKFQVGDMVVISHDWGEKEVGVIDSIPNGSEIAEVDILFNDGSYGTYRPEDCEQGPV